MKINLIFKIIGMKKIIILAVLGTLFVSCKKEYSISDSETIRLGENTVQTLNPPSGSMVKRILLSQTNFVSSIRGQIESEQEALGRDIYDFEVSKVQFAFARTNAADDASDPLSNYLSDVNIYFDKNDGSQAIKIATAESVNTDMTILQSDLASLASQYPDFIIYYTAVFDQVPTDIRNALIDTEFNVSTSYKYKEKK